jgi:tetratricopeptide (TPR) repeat protein
MSLFFARGLLVAAVVAQAGAPTNGGGRPAADVVAQLDALHLRRDDRAALVEARRLAETAVAASPGDYAVLWRAARARFDESDVPTQSNDERSRLGKEAYDLAERAIAVNPNAVEGQYWAALGIGNYAKGIGIMRALANGIEDKFKHPLERATALDVRYNHGAIPVVWAAYYLSVPWPKRDRAKAATELKRALEINPANLRARLYQARLASDEGHPDQARALLAAIASATVGAYDVAEERRVKTEAAQMAQTLH